jgi:hypothetical protein
MLGIFTDHCIRNDCDCLQSVVCGFGHLSRIAASMSGIVAYVMMFWRMRLTSEYGVTYNDVDIRRGGDGFLRKVLIQKGVWVS